MSKKIIRVHQPLWGGFPKHWVAGPATSWRLVEDMSGAGYYLPEEQIAITKQLSAKYPSAVITPGGI